MKHIKYLIATIFVLCVSIPTSSNADSDKIIIKIGTGSKEALAYPTVSTICEIFNKYTNRPDIQCQTISTGGSKDNLKGMLSKKFEMGIIKSDMQYDAYNGIGDFSDNPRRELRALFGLHMEYLTFIAKEDILIKSLDDLRGKRIYIGNEGSGSRMIVDKLLKKMNFGKGDFKKIYEVRPEKLKDLFCKGKIDVAIYMVGHPNKLFSQILKECDTKLINVSRKDLEEYIDILRYISIGLIKKNIYDNQYDDVKTFSSQLLLATSDVVDEEIIYEFIKTIVIHYDKIQNIIPSLKNIDLLDSLSNANSIPFHKGANRYYKLQLLSKE